MAGYKVPSKHIYFYSFSLKGYEDDMTLQPTGSCNFSRIDTKIMRFSNNNGNINAFFEMD